VASGIAWLHRYRDDPFFRTEVNAIALQLAFAAFMIAVVSASYMYNSRNVSTAITSSIRSGLISTPSSSLGPIILTQIENIRTQNFAIVLILITLATVVFGYIIARITLSPVRNALTAQKQFIGNIAHELRTPIAIIKTNTEIGLMENKLTADMKSMMASNIEELDRISEIINNLLSLSALINPEKMVFRPLDLSALTQEVAEKFERLAEVSGNRLTVHTKTPAWIIGNATALTQVIGNLLKNAINYTPPNGAITVAVSINAHNQIELYIRDTGIGIARKDLDRIFEPFYRAEQSRTRSKGGSGLGLSIAAEMVKLHKGHIAIRSSLGRGTTVTVKIPALASAQIPIVSTSNNFILARV
jgi:signal transduction histidine kinase